MGEAKLVMIAMRDEITAHGVEQLLIRSDELTIVRADSHGEHIPLPEMLLAQPAILITDEADSLSWKPEISGLFDICPDLRVVVVSSKANCALLFRREKSCYETRAEFLDFIEACAGN